MPRTDSIPPINNLDINNSENISESDEEESSGSFVSNSGNDDDTSSSSVISWITWFCSLPGHGYFAQVPEDFVEDDFNLTGLSAIIQMYNEALDTILDMELEETPHHDDLTIIEESAEQLYGMIHQRYILTKPGLEAMSEKYLQGDFGTCPRYLCGKSKVLPVGRADKLGCEGVKLYCGRCLDIYSPRENHAGIDGAYFGTTFSHLFFLSYPNLMPPIGAAVRTDDDEDEELDEYEVYVPRIFGFKVNEQSISGPRMSWLRFRSGMLQ